ncbi:MAG: NAD-dependent dehydratase [Methanobacterium sp. BRmetb2]|nr:MAG: NAD-dependent dehydratase [Methanobacterium sp. BRmetb2]
MNLKGKSVLLTGAGGFIGSHLSEALIDLNVDLKAFVRYNSRNDWGMLEYLPRDKVNSLEVITGDLRDYDAIRDAVKDVDVIFHLASLISIPYSYVHPRENVETNVMGTFNVLMAARDYQVEKIVHTSTSETYGTARYVPIDEEHPLQGQSPYSASKIGADKIAESFHLSYELPVATIRPFNTFGPRQSSRAVIPTIISQALTKDELQLGSLHPTRDYTYVKDLAQGFIKVGESPESVGEVINIGSNFEISIGDLTEKIISLIGRDVTIQTDQSRIRPSGSEVERLWCDNSKAKRLLNWEPSMSLDEGLQETINWIRENVDLHKTDIYNR